MPINPSAVGAKSEPHERSWTSKDCLLYAVGVGAGSLDPTGLELDFTTENSDGVAQRVLPTFGVIVGMGGVSSDVLGTYDGAAYVHGGQALELLSELPPEGTVSVQSQIAAIYDKGTAAVVVTESEAVDVATGKPLMRSTMTGFIRGEGGWGGDRGPSGSQNAAPERAPDHAVTYQTRPDQALIYRLSGDRNPLHSDPTFAKRAGFPKPILHGLCTFGFTGRALLHTLCGSDPARFRSIDVRFSRPVFPGDALEVQIWVDGNEALFRTVNQSGDVVIDNGRFRFE
ncbi:MAG TPA: MaoC/PaaZ C-terminal domain-containing protein [Acidimicrobiales bacterium]|jgi:acyl dehydratase